MKRIIFHLPFTPYMSIIHILLLLVLIFFPGIVGLAFIRIGLPPWSIALVLLISLVGSFVNIVIREKMVSVDVEPILPPILHYLFDIPPIRIRRRQILAINVGGGIIPTMVAIYVATRLPLLQFLVSLIILSVLVNRLSKVVQGMGIVVPGIIPPILAVLLAYLLYPQAAPPLAFSSGVLVTLLGADIMNLNKLGDMPGLVSIGGAGVFDGIYLTGVLAALLA